MKSKNCLTDFSLSPNSLIQHLNLFYPLTLNYLFTSSDLPVLTICLLLEADSSHPINMQ